MKWWLKVALPAVVLLAGGAVLWGVRTHRGSDSAAADQGRGGSTLHPAAPVLASWQAPRRSLSLTYSAKVSQSGGLLMELSLDGELALVGFSTQVLAHAPGQPGAVWRVTYTGQAKVNDASGDGDDAALTPLLESLRAPFYVVFGPGGDVRELRFPKGMMRLAQTTWRSVLLATQVLGDEGEAEWTSSELDENGRYEARYARQPDGELRKAKVRYQSSNAAGTTHQLRSHHSAFRFEAKGKSEALGTLLSVRESQGLSATSELGFDFDADTELTLTLRSIDAVEGKPEWLAELQSYEVMGLLDAGTRSAVMREIDQSMARGFTVQSAMLALMPGKDGKQNERASKAYHGLLGLVRLDPNSVSALVEHILQGGPLKRQLISVLRDAGTPAAQKALRDLLTAPALNEVDHRQLVAALGRVDNPTPETIDTLKGLIDHPTDGRQAAYSLGGDAYRLAESEPGRAREVVDYLLGRLGTATTDPARETALVALGNAGSPMALDALEQTLKSGAPSLQDAAIGSLRRTPGPRAEQLLLNELAAPQPDLRRTALDTLRYRTPSDEALSALGGVLRQDTDDSVRLAAVGTAAFFLPKHPELAEVLRSVAASDPSPKVRAAAQSAVGG